MYIVYENDEENISYLKEKYIVLELDTIDVYNGDYFTAYCVIDNEHIPMQEISEIEHFKDKHHVLMEKYKSQNWNDSLELIKELKGKFKGEVDSFYEILENRIETLKDASNEDQKENWTGRISASKSIS